MDISLDTVKLKISGLLRRYHLIIFVVIAIGGLIFVMFELNIVIRNASSDSVTTPQPASFDQKTMDNIRKLQSSGQGSSPLKTSGRSNPFVE